MDFYNNILNMMMKMIAPNFRARKEKKEVKGEYERIWGEEEEDFMYIQISLVFSNVYSMIKALC